MKDNKRLRSLRSWFGMTVRVDVSNPAWHRVRVLGVPFDHPAVVNLILRRGMPEQLHRSLSLLHEYGHLQTIPVALVHGLLLWRRRQANGESCQPRLMQVIAHQALWEMATEGYVMAKTGRDYRRIYRQYPNRSGMAFFWGIMTLLAIAGSWGVCSGDGKTKPANG